MNSSQKPSSFNLTSYALGEVSAEEIPSYEVYLEMDPEAKAEYQRILEMVRVLDQYPPAPTRRLHPKQLQTVLKGPANPRKRLQPASILPFYQRPAFKYAVAASLTLGAFILGHLTSHQVNKPNATNTAQGDLITTPIEITQTEPIVEETPYLQTSTPSDFQRIYVESLEPKSRPQLETFRKVQEELAAHKAAPHPPQVQQKSKERSSSTPLLDIIAKIPSNSDPISMRGFKNTLVSTQDTFEVNPQFLRPKRKDSGDQKFAAIAKPSSNGNNTTSKKPVELEQPPLQIKSWKAEIASCPWDPTRRLLRIVIQTPANQAGILFQDAAYRLQVKFDPFQILGFRAVAEKHIAPESDTHNATRIMWYELIPSRNFAATDVNPIQIGQLTLRQPKSVASHPVPTLNLMDSGISWRNAREDFVFETSMVGLGLLLQGYDNTSFLDHSVVREIAENYKGKDEDGSRAKFIELIRLAQQAGGVKL